MLFRKRRKPGGRPAGGAPSISPPPTSYLITFDMMQKGAKVQRHRRIVRQIAVMVGTQVYLVTSGDTVDRPVYEALIAAGVVLRPPQSADLLAEDGGAPEAD